MMLLAASLPEMFAYGATGFWIAVVAFVIWMILATSYEHNFASTLSVIAFCVFLQVIGVDVLGTLFTNPLHLVGAIVLWGVIGIAYSFLKWTRLNHAYAKQYDYFFAKFVAAKGLPEGTTQLSTQTLKEEWVKWVNGNNYYFDSWAKGPIYSGAWSSKEYGPIYEEPESSKHMYHIIHWIAYWPINAPISAFIFLCEDVLIEFGRWAYYFLGDMYQAVTRSIFRSRNVNANLPDEIVARKTRKK